MFTKGQGESKEIAFVVISKVWMPFAGPAWGAIMAARQGLCSKKSSKGRRTENAW
jgi:hypothetical protein